MELRAERNRPRPLGRGGGGGGGRSGFPEGDQALGERDGARSQNRTYITGTRHYEMSFLFFLEKAPSGKLQIYLDCL